MEADQQKITEQLGEKFLLQYYKIASESNADLHKFYQKDAACSYNDASIVVGPSKITDKLAFLNSARFDLETGGTTVAFQYMKDGSILIMVSGLVSLRENNGEYSPYRRFVQTFVLAKGPGQESRYYISNDMLRFVPGSAAVLPIVAPVSSPAPVAVAPQPVQAKVEKPAEVEKPAASQPPKEAAAEKPKPARATSGASKPPQQQQQAAATPAPAPEVAAPAPPPKPSGPPSYSQVAAKSSNNSPSNSPSAAPVKEAAAAPQRTTVASPPPANAVLVKNVERKITADHLKEAFKPFGIVSGIQFRQGAAIVTFGEQKEADALVAAKELTVEGITLQVELHRPAPKSGNGGGRGRPDGQRSAPRAAGSAPQQAAAAQGGRPPKQTGGASGSGAARGGSKPPGEGAQNGRPSAPRGSNGQASANGSGRKPATTAAAQPLTAQ